MITAADFAGKPGPISTEEQHAINAYADLMSEIRDRSTGIGEVFSEHVKLPNHVQFEFAYLQIRMILETLALSCLVAHGDLKEVRASQLQKAYQADFIIKRLDRLHPDFFPIPHVTEIDDGKLLGGRRIYHFLETEGPRLTKADVISMYSKAGARLHRGSLKGLSRALRDLDAEVAQINEFLEKLIALLGAHHIMTLDRRTVFLCNIPDEGEGQVTVKFAATSGNRGSTSSWIAVAEQ